MKVIKFNDYGCGHCLATARAYAPVFARLQAEFPGAVTFEQREYPGEAACNPRLAGLGRPGACEAALLSYAAMARGRKEAFARWLYANPTANPRSVQQAFAEIVGPLPDAALRANLGERLEEDVVLAERLGVDATPVFWINGVLVNALPAHVFEALLRLELRDQRALSLAGRGR